MVVGFSGSRSSVSLSSSACVAAVLSSVSKITWGLVLVGCCHSGVDLLVRQICLRRFLAWRLFFVNGIRSAAKLRSRTLSMVAESEILFSFPKSASVIHSGTWLATFAAFESNKPVFVFLSGVSSSELPLCRGVGSWVQVPGASLPVPVPGFSFWVPKKDGVSQIDIFNS